MKGAKVDGRFNMGFGLIIIGIVIAIFGVILLVIDKIPLLGKLPGDINISGKGWSFHFPIVTCIIISLLLTVILNLIFRR